MTLGSSYLSWILLCPPWGRQDQNLLPGLATRTACLESTGCPPHMLLVGEVDLTPNPFPSGPAEVSPITTFMTGPFSSLIDCHHQASALDPRGGGGTAA